MRPLSVIVVAALAAAAPAPAAEFKDAQAAFKEGDYFKAVAILDEYMKDHPKDTRGYVLRGRALVETKQFDKAIPDLDKVLEDKKGERGSDHFYRGRARAGLGKYAEAIEDFDKAIEANPRQVDRYVERGKARRNFSDNIKALADFAKATELDPKNADAWSELGRSRFQDACEFETRSYMNNGQTYVMQVAKSVKDKAGVEQAVAAFSRAIELNADHIDAIQSRMYAYQMLGNKGADRISDLKSLCRLQPENPNLWNDLAWDRATHYVASFRNGKEAVEAAEKAVRLTENKNSLFLDTLAASYAEAGDFKKAVATESEAIEKNNHTETKAAFQKRLELYKAGKAYHRPRPAKPPKDLTPEE